MESGMAPSVQSQAPAMVATPQSANVSSAVPSAAPAPASNDKTVKVNSPMVGTFYRSPAPDAKPFVQEGARIEAGQVFCIIEAMKLMNEIKSEVSGKIVKILLANGQAVEFGQPILVVDPS
jgi:acetyl-CoA carboxylase biotin carboxyl carrier protein